MALLGCYSNNLGLDEGDFHFAMQCTYDLDAVGNVKHETLHIAGLSPTVQYTATFASGEQDTFAAKIGTQADFANSYDYDELHRLSEFTQQAAGGNAVAAKHFIFEYNGYNNLTSIQRDTTRGNRNVATSSYGYDNVGRLTSLTHHHNSTTLADYSWSYDALGRIEHVTNADGTATYTYDAAGQLTDTVSSNPAISSEHYTYDANGNRTDAGNNTWLGHLNRLEEDAKYTYQYDNEGNRTRRSEKTTGAYDIYTWDYNNRLTSVEHHLANTTLVWSVSYTYDYENRLISRTSPTGTEYFTYDGNQIVLRLDAQGNVLDRYTWGPNTDQLLADVQYTYNPDNTLATDNLFWALGDDENSVKDLVSYNEVTDTAQIVDHRNYDSFGQKLSNSNPSIDTLIGWTGRYLDPLTGLQNNLNRWYDSFTHQWVSDDPKSFDAGDPNLRRYAGNDSVNGVDPSGLDKFSIDGKGNAIWHTYNSYSEEYVPIQIGELRGGWVYFNEQFGGGRSTHNAIYNAAYHASTTHKDALETIQDRVNATRSPFVIENNSPSINIFLDGTSNCIAHQTNIAKLYNACVGTKFYYGGVGNEVDFDYGISRGVSMGVGLGWTKILDAAEADIIAQAGTRGAQINIFGFSRGAAMANELARRLERKDIKVNFLGMFDPVYSRGLPGQSSNLVTTDGASTSNNSVNGTISSNVANATVIYPIHETRTYFPYTRLTAEKGTNVQFYSTPGQHSDAGGHYGNVRELTLMNLHVMARSAEANGVVFSYNQRDRQIASIFDSKYLRSFDSDNYQDRWYKQWQNGDWSIPSNSQFNSLAEKLVAKDIKLAGYGVQRDGAGINLLFMINILGGAGGIQPVYNWNPRNLAEVPSLKNVIRFHGGEGISTEAKTFFDSNATWNRRVNPFLKGGDQWIK